MKNVFLRMKEKLSGQFAADEEIPEESGEEEYVELGTDIKEGEERAKIIVRPFIMEDFDDIKPILDSLREGYTIALINIRPLKDKDLVELKRAINKLKKTTDAVEGDIAGFGEDYIVVTPSFANIYRTKDTPELGAATEETPEPKEPQQPSASETYSPETYD